MNHKITLMLEDYLQLLQLQDIDNDKKITELKLLIQQLESEKKYQAWLFNLTASNRYYKR